MKKFLALFLSVCMLCTLLAVPAAAAETGSSWAKESEESIKRWTEAGIMDVEEDGSFDSGHQLTRAEFAVMLCRLMGYTEKAEASTFDDLPADKEAADALLKLAKLGIMQGNGRGQVHPDGPLDRESTAVLMFRALNMKADAKAEGEQPRFEDEDKISPWAKAEMAAMTSKKMLEGNGVRLNPLANISQVEMAVLMNKMIAAYVTRDNETVDITEAVNPYGAVIIRAKNVKIANAENSSSIYVAADAGGTVTVNGPATDITLVNENAKLTVAKNGTVDSVEATQPKAAITVNGAAGDITLAGENSKLTVAKGAEVDSVAAEAPKATVTVNGTVGDVSVGSEAESAKVTVAKGAEAGNVTVEAPKAAVEVSGTVGTVAVAEGADKTTVTAKTGAKVDSVTTSAEGVKVNGANKTIGTVVADAGSAEVKAKGAEVTNDGADSVKVDNKVVAAGDSQTSSQTGSGTSDYTGGGSYVPPTTPVTPEPETKYTLTTSIVKAQGVDNDSTSVILSSSSCAAGGTITATVTSKKNIAVVLTYDNADKTSGAKPVVNQQGNASGGYTYTITFDMPSTNAKLVIGVLNACQDDYTPVAGLSACFGGNNTDEGVLSDGLDAPWGTYVPNEQTT